MPISSYEISRLNDQFQQATMAHMQHANMIGQIHNPDAIAGSMMNTGAAIAGPAAMGGMALLGADPFSVGVSTTMRMAPRMGLMGAGMAGLGAAGVVGAGIMGAQYIGGQMMQGAQQQQQLGSMLNMTNPFINAQGGVGFTRAGLGNIGSMMRNMSTEQGSMGQMAGFEELGRLASNMGRMGMTQGVRDAKDFSDRFKEMVKSVKEIAESMSTSLEEAQKMMGSMRQSGVFGGGNAAAVAQKIRAGALGGGLATSEVTGMMQVGSQISRMVGGRGRAGAMGGIEAISNIGAAQQLGVISEEDIYNVTGLTGAEGRRAMATRQMQQSAQFLRGGIGRRFLASVAGENGELDESSLEEWLSGGVGTGRTMQMANRNLGRVGKADFIRNEGKLRGAVMERLGGLAPMLSLSSMLKERGINVNEDSDRAMIFMQRQLGMGDDEANMMLRQVQNLPRILRERSDAVADDKYMSTERQRLSQTGLEGVKNKLKKARADVQATAQQAGADIQQGLSTLVEETINRITDHHIRRLRQDVSGSARSMMGGGAMGEAAAASTFGIGGGNILSGGILGSGTGMGGSLLADYTSRGSAAKALERFNDIDAERFKDAGFEYKGGSLSEHIQMVGQISDAFQSGGAGLSGREGIAALGKANRRAFAQAKLSGVIGGKGMGRLEGFGEFLGGLSGAGALAKRFAGADNVEKAQIMAAFGGKDSNFKAPQLLSDYAAGGFFSESEAARGLGSAFTAGDRKYSHISEKIGENLRSEEFLKMYKGLFSTDASARNEAITGAYDRLEQASAEHGKLGFFSKDKNNSLARIQALQGTIAAGELADLKASGASQEEIDVKVKELATQFGTSPEFILNQASAVQAEGKRSQGEARAQLFERFGGEARKNLSALRRGGLVTGTGSSLKLSSAALGKAGISGTGQKVLQAMLSEQTALASAGAGSSAAEQDAAGRALRGAGAARREALGSMSVAEMRALSDSLEGIAGTGDMRSDINRTAGTGAALQKGGASAAAGMLGLNIDKKQAAALMKGGGVDALAKEFATQMGGADNENLLKDLRSMLKDVTGGKAGSGAVKMEGFLNNEDVQNMLKKIQQEKDKQDPNKNLEQISNYMETLTKRSEAANTHLKTIADWTLKESESFF